jgi:uncharacterized protein (DUF488 family)
MSMLDRPPSPPLTILTVGHSNRPLAEFLQLLQAQGVTLVVDVRKMPGSRRNPQFGRDTLPLALRRAGIGYLHTPGLGGLRRRRPDSPNTGWENASFQGYADYMLTPEFQQNLQELLERADGERAALMCAEAVPWRCHRSLIADALAVRGVVVEHILGPSRTQQHELRPWARVQGTRLIYPPSAEDSGRDTLQSLIARPRKRGSRRHGP